MKARFARFPFVVVLASSNAIGALACAASFNAVYEGDVRFEHCMALDERPEGKSTKQKTCWDEWVKYYTFGQTRDRVDYARKRQKELSGASDFSDSYAPATLAQRAVPEPTSAFAPPPIMLTDAGKAPEPDASAAPAVAEPPAAACATQCREAWQPCKTGCSSPACERACEKKYRTCMKKCF